MARQTGVVSYFIGNDPKQWRTGIPTYGKVDYAAGLPGHGPGLLRKPARVGVRLRGRLPAPTPAASPGGSMARAPASTAEAI